MEYTEKQIATTYVINKGQPTQEYSLLIGKSRRVMQYPRYWKTKRGPKDGLKRTGLFLRIRGSNNDEI